MPGSRRGTFASSNSIPVPARDAISQEELVSPAAPMSWSPTSRSCSISSRRSEEHTSELQSRLHLVCRLLLEKKKKSMILALRRNLLSVQLELPLLVSHFPLHSLP